ncbi:MAG: phenylalanine--tRNA ligase subunit beta [Fimbriimonadaceae bacterium]
MKFTEAMIRELVDSPLSPQEIGDTLTMAGLELESIAEEGGAIVFDVGVMANRGDAASVLGMARELVAKHPASMPRAAMDALTGWSDLKPLGAGEIKITTERCTRYSAMVFEGVTNGPSPQWLQECLTALGQRPISILVDLTNYVMLVTGQPMHAFDLDKLPGPRIVVRNAANGEKLETLDGIERELVPDDVVITDGTRPIALAGIMGGRATEVGPDTTRCLLESAHFDNQSVRATRTRLGMHTEASYRFERWVDPCGTVRAMDLFARLLEATPSETWDSWSAPPRVTIVSVRPSRAARLLGCQVSPEDCLQYLERLGFKPQAKEESVHCTVPSWRNDIALEEDLVEEIGRMHGYEHIGTEPPIGSTPVGGAHGSYLRLDRLRARLIGCSLVQTMSHTLRDTHPLDSQGERVRVRTPHSPETALLRNSLLPCLAEAAARNGGRDLALFEVGRTFSPNEHASLAILMTGRAAGAQEADFFALKGVVEAAIGKLEWSQGADPRLHPTRQAEASGIGVFGQVHPLVAAQCDLAPSTVLAEFDLDAWLKTTGADIHFRPLYRHPAVRRDIAIEVSKQVAYREIEAAISASGGGDLESYWLFDVYEGKGVAEGARSLAIALVFRKDGNLTDEEANRARDVIVGALQGLGARLR